MDGLFMRGWTSLDDEFAAVDQDVLLEHAELSVALQEAGQLIED